MKAATYMPPFSMDEMQAKITPVLEAFNRLLFLLKETQENYIREKARSTIIMEASAHLGIKARALASKEFD